MEVDLKQVKAKPIQLRSSHPFFAKWYDFVEWKENTLNEWLLRLAARAVERVKANDDSMDRLADYFEEDWVKRNTHQTALDLVGALNDSIAGLRKKEEKLKRKSRVVRKRNVEIRALKEEAKSLEAALDFLLNERGQSRAEFYADILQMQADIASAEAEIAETIAEVEDELTQANLALKALKK